MDPQVGDHRMRQHLAPRRPRGDPSRPPRRAPRARRPPRFLAARDHGLLRALSGRAAAARSRSAPPPRIRAAARAGLRRGGAPVRARNPATPPCPPVEPSPDCARRGSDRGAPGAHVRAGQVRPHPVRRHLGGGRDLRAAAGDARHGDRGPWMAEARSQHRVDRDPRVPARVDPAVHRRGDPHDPALGVRAAVDLHRDRVLAHVRPAGLGSLYLGPSSRKVAGLFEAQGPSSPAAIALLNRLLPPLAAGAGLFVVTIGLMVFKPTIG